MFANTPINHLGALLSELCASAVELATLGEVRLPPPQRRRAHRRRRPGTAALHVRHEARVKGRVLMLWPELDEALIRTPDRRPAEGAPARRSRHQVHGRSPRRERGARATRRHRPRA